MECSRDDSDCDWNGEIEALQAALSVPGGGAWQQDEVEGVVDGSGGSGEVSEGEATDRSGSGSSSPSPPSPPATTSVALVTPPKKKRKRGQQKEEIESLRTKVKELTALLANMTSRFTDPNRVAIDVEFFSAWNEIQSRQLQLRKGSEMENARLRGMLESQLILTRQLIAYICPAKPAKFPDAGICTDADLHQRLDGLHKRLQQELSSSLFGVGQRTFRHINVEDVGDGAVVVESQVSWVVPFDCHDVGRALWHDTTVGTMEKVQAYYESFSLSDELLAATGIVLVDPKFGYYRAQCGTRQHLSPDGTMMVGILRAQPIEDVSERALLSSYYYHGEAWMRVQRIETGSQSTPPGCPARALTQVQWSRRANIRHLGEADVAPTIGTLTETLVGLYQKDIDMVQGTLESTLLRQQHSMW
ncbi:hypothetical protein Poli38472_004902 [Pythium oligandrum]|uniref:Uncharacterized protein n=1 Tax=Pythium oligandrum TaxID=41045 RepID=A0A8K1FIK1_PYTOL|nr:hypothetical protein Poli38472_004902 [Pythium oligandrum]|eukprot:TMW59833.1 hypothetical protein Poli38472_004902 [Pythium oligandrum]